MSLIVFRNAAVLDAQATHRREGSDVVVENGTIREVAERPVALNGATVIDIGGRTLMPGLIDCHVHVVATILDLGANAALPNALVTLKSVPIMRAMLERGFTTVRDACGADYALALAVESGLVVGPRLFVAGRALSQTGGHGDLRGRFDEREQCLCCRRAGVLGRVADGVDGVRKATREEIKAGANQIKVMASGGIASPTDPIAYLGYSTDELRAICQEAAAAQTYVMAHAYTAAAIRRAVECGVRTIEHGNLVDADAARLMAAKGAYAVPTLITYDVLAKYGPSLGFPQESIDKIDDVRKAGLRSLEIFKQAGVKMAYGTDLLGALHEHQSSEFRLRAQVLTPHEVISSATSVAAEILNMAGKLGMVTPGAVADLLVVDGDPLADLGLLEGQGRSIAAIMKAGIFFKNRLGAAPATP